MPMARNKGKRISRYTPDYVVFDLETTGISVAKDDIIEISAIKVVNHQVTEEFSTLVNPERHIPSGATAVNGITDDMVRSAPKLETALSDFLDFIGKDILVGHNIHTFDTNFVYDAALGLFHKEVRNDYIDTLYMARSCLPHLAHHRLLDVSEYFKISTQGAHRALCDCTMNQLCYEELGKLLKPEEVLCCPVCGSELARRSGRFGAFYGCTNYPRCKYTRNIS